MTQARQNFVTLLIFSMIFCGQTSGIRDDNSIMKQMFGKDMTTNNKQSNQRYENALFAGNGDLERTFQSKENNNSHHNQEHLNIHDHVTSGNHKDEASTKSKIQHDYGHNHAD